MNLYIKIIILQWIITPLFILPIILSKEIIYESGSFVCQIPLSNISLSIYLFIISYGIPMFFIIILHLYIARFIKKYWKLHRQKFNITRTYIICPIQRITLIILVLIISYFPYGILFIFEQLKFSIVSYAQKICMIFASLSITLTMILIFCFSRSVRKSFFSK